MFFITFMQLANLIFVNIIIAFVIDTYQSIDETLEAEQEAKNINLKDDEEDKQESVEEPVPSPNPNQRITRSKTNNLPPPINRFAQNT